MNCLLCGRKLTGQRTDAKFCSCFCRWRYHYFKRAGKEEKIERERATGERIEKEKEEPRIGAVGSSNSSLKDVLDRLKEF